MTDRFGWKQGFVEGVSLQQQKPTAQFHFDILQQLKSVTVAQQNQPQGSVIFTWREGVLAICKNQKVKVAGI